MLPPFIIERIREREQRERTHAPQPYLELPLLPAREPREQREPEERDRGVVIIDLLAD